MSKPFYEIVLIYVFLYIYKLSQILALCTNVTSELEGSRREVQ